MIRFIENSFLPENDVRCVISHIDDIRLNDMLHKFNIEILNCIEKPNMMPYIANHADAMCYYFGKGKIIVDESQKAIINGLCKLDFNVLTVNNVSSPYPFDCRLNVCDIGDYVICNSRITDKAIIHHYDNNKKIIDVNQGYSKCSVCIIRKNTIITDDESIYNAVQMFDNIKCLKVSKGSVNLKGCNYGFIGGCSGLIGKNKLLFNGDLSLHSDSEIIKRFLYNNDVEYFDIKNKPLTDIGSIIPVIEKGDF